MRSFEVKMNAKGQITLPAKLRREWNLQRGDKVEFYFDRMNILRVRRRNLPPSAVWESAPRRRLPPQSKKMTDDEAIMAAVIEKDRRSRLRNRKLKK
jgi:AbrB family looped-hinge helix DNA binding protein